MKIAVICLNSLMYHVPCEFPVLDVPPMQFLYGPAIDGDAYASSRMLEPVFPDEIPLVALRPPLEERFAAFPVVPVPGVKPKVKALAPVGESTQVSKKRQTRDQPLKEVVGESLTTPTPRRRKTVEKAPVMLAYAPSSTKGLGAIVEGFLDKKAGKNPKALYVKADGNEDMGCAEKNAFLMSTLRKMRAKWGKPVIVDSAYRSPAHNKAVSGAKQSYHMSCRALDVKVPGVDKDTLAAWLRNQPGMGGVGVYKSSFVHFDNGRRRNWDWRRG